MRSAAGVGSTSLASATSSARGRSTAADSLRPATGGLRRSADRKVTNLPSTNGKTARIANSFGLPAGRGHSCPGATATCERVCYAGKLEKLYRGVLDVLTGNMQALAGLDRFGMARLLADMISDFRADCDRAEKRGAKVPRDFRIHWDGTSSPSRTRRPGPTSSEQVPMSVSGSTPGASTLRRSTSFLSSPTCPT